MRYFVFGHNVHNPEAHLWDIYVGEQPPIVHLFDHTLQEEFDQLRELCHFLESQKVDQIAIFRDGQCPEELVEDLTQWADLNLSLHNIIVAGEGQDVA